MNELNNRAASSADTSSARRQAENRAAASPQTPSGQGSGQGSADRNIDPAERQRRIYRVTIAGSVVNVSLLIFKFIAGFVGNSAAMIADAVHSLTDFATDIIVLLFVRLGSKPVDKDHDYGHGKYETLATAVIGIALLGVGAMICYQGVMKTWMAIQGYPLRQPGIIALVAALASIGLKEWAYRFTYRTGKEVHSEATVANAWHHRSDALSSIGTALGIGGAILLGRRWAVLDPIAAIIVSVFIIKAAFSLVRQAFGELLEQSLPEAVETEIMQIAEDEEGVSEIHNLRTRSLGNHIAIEMHVRMAGDTTLYAAHEHATHIERRLKERFGQETHVALHVEPLKVNGAYVCPE